MKKDMLQRGILEEELRLVGTYGLRNKRELWRNQTELSTLRRRAREMLSMDPEDRVKREHEIIGKLYNLGLVPERATLDDILGLSVQDLMERRLQTILYRNGMAKSLFQARQLITHGHVAIGGLDLYLDHHTVVFGGKIGVAAQLLRRHRQLQFVNHLLGPIVRVGHGHIGAQDPFS